MLAFTHPPSSRPRSVAHVVLGSALIATCLLSAPVQSADGENSHVEYAQVLRVQPVYETRRATRMEQRCTPAGDAVPGAGDEKESALSRIAGSVKRIFSPDAPEPAATPLDAVCTSVPVERTFNRPYAYDVDYVYKGTKYRSRLPRDPGNRLPIKVSVTPVMNAEPR